MLRTALGSTRGSYFGQAVELCWLSDRHNDFHLLSIMTAMLELGAFLGALMAGFLADKYSRRISIAIGLVWFAIGSATQTASSHYNTLVVGRTLGGVGVGLLSSTAPMYVAEVSK